jgi:hypothetical protein
MDIKELNKWIDGVQDNINFLQREIQGIKAENDKKLKTMQSSLNYHLDEIKGMHELQKSKIIVKPSIESYLLKKIEMSPQFKEGVKKLENGENVDMTLGVKMKNKELPLELKRDGVGNWTKEIESTLDDEVLRDRVEEHLKGKDFVKDNDGFHAE